MNWLYFKAIMSRTWSVRNPCWSHMNTISYVLARSLLMLPFFCAFGFIHIINKSSHVMDFDCDAAGTVFIRWHAKMNLFVWLQFILLAKEWKEEFVKANTRMIDSFPAVLSYFITFDNSRWFFFAHLQFSEHHKYLWLKVSARDVKFYDIKGMWLSYLRYQQVNFFESTVK